MMPMGWNQIRQARVPGAQPQMNNNMGHHHQGFNPAMNQQGPMMTQHQPEPGMTQQGAHMSQHFNHSMNQQQHQMMGHNQQSQPYDMYHNQFMPQPQQQMYQHQMMAYPMPGQQMMMEQPAPKPPEPKGNPPPSPLPPLPKDEPPPPPVIEEKWWVAEMSKLPSVHHREELERLSGEKWFQSMNMHQQIECWQHKMQLITTQNKGAEVSRSNNSVSNTSTSFSSKPIVSAPPVSAPSPLRKSDFKQTGNIDADLEKAKQEENSVKEQIVTFERQYGEWKKQFDDWKEKHKAHPNKQQFAHYENQWMSWQQQMSEQKKQLDTSLNNVCQTIQELQNKKSEYLQQQQHKPFSQSSNVHQQSHHSYNIQDKQFSETQSDNFPFQTRPPLPPPPDFAKAPQPRFSAPGVQDNQRFVPPVSSYSDPSHVSQQRHLGPRQQRQPGPGQGSNFNPYQGPRHRFNSRQENYTNFDNNRQFNEQSFRTPNAPRFRGNRPDLEKQNYNEADDTTYDESQYEEENDELQYSNNYNNFPNRVPHNQGMRGLRPGVRSRGAFPQRGMAPGRGQRGNNRFARPQRPLHPQEEGFLNTANFRGPRPRFPGARQRFPGPRGPITPGARPTRPRFPNIYEKSYDDYTGGYEGEEDYSQEAAGDYSNQESYMEDEFNQYKNETGSSEDNSGNFEDHGGFANDKEKDFADDNFDELGENTGAPIKQSPVKQEPDVGKDNKEEKPYIKKERDETDEVENEPKEEDSKKKEKEWKVDRSMCPLRFGVPEDKKSSLSETFTVHDAKPEKKVLPEVAKIVKNIEMAKTGARIDTLHDAKPEKKVLPEVAKIVKNIEMAKTGVRIDPKDDYSHYAEDYTSYDDGYNRYPHEEISPVRGRGGVRGALYRGRGRGRGGDPYQARGRGGKPYRGRGGMLKPPHVLMQESGAFSNKNMRRQNSLDAYSALSARDHSFNSKLQPPTSRHHTERGTVRIPSSTPPSIDTDAVMQKAKELSNIDIKNLLSAVKTLKGTQSGGEQSQAITVHTGAVRQSGVNTDYNTSEYSDEAPSSQYDYLAGGDSYSAMSDPLQEQLANDRLTEADLVAAGLDPVALGLRDEDLLLQEYLMDPLLNERLLRDPLASDPYLEREMLLRTIEETETARRDAELRRKQQLMRPILEKKIVETIDYSHGLSKSGAGEKRTRDPDTIEAPRDYDRPLDRDRMSPRRQYEREYMERDRFSPSRDYPDYRGRPSPPRDWRPRPSSVERDWGPPRRGPSPSRLVVVTDDVMKERESMERHRMSIDRERRSMERRRSSLDRSRNSREREEERVKRERSLERLKKLERELMEREKMLNDREDRLKIPDRERRARYEERRHRNDWKPEGGRERTPPRRRFEERPRSRERRFRERTPEPDRGRDKGREWDRGRSPPWRKDDRSRDWTPGRDDRRRDDSGRRGRGRDERNSPDYSMTRPSVPTRDRRRFTSPSGSSRTGSPKPPAKMMKLVPVIVRVEDLLNDPARQRRPKRIVIILRGLPGSGKSQIAKMIRDAESSKGVTPRVLGLDDYFMVENEKTETDPDSGKRVKKKVLEYEYEAAMEPSYRNSLLRAFKKTLDDGYFNFVIVDSVNDKVEYFSEFWTLAKKASFEVYVAEIHADVDACVERSEGRRSIQDIQKIFDGWEETPGHMIRLDVRQMLQDSEIQEVEMGDVSDEGDNGGGSPELTVEQLAGVPQSKWELMEKMERLDKLDGIKKKKLKSSVQHMADFLSVTDDYEERSSAPGKKRVRWADIEEKSTQRRMREVGFVVGQTDWSRMMGDDSHADKALNRTKFI